MMVSCSPSPQPINYGKEECHSCKMTIVDMQHASQIVTNTSKAFKYDAIECMLHDAQENVALTLVCDYATPQKLIDATKAFYLVSENVPSPMGANLSAFESHEKAMEMQKSHGGEVFDWEGIRAYFEVDSAENHYNHSMHDH